MNGSQIIGIGSCRPGRIVTSEELARETGHAADWYLTRTGIRQRRIATKDESVVTMAVRAGVAALEDAGLEPAMVDMVVVCTSTHDRPAPAAAPEVANKMGAFNAGAFDLNAVCAGFAYGVSVAAGLMSSGSARCVVVIGADKLSTMIGPEDPDTYALFADGAGAVVVQRCDANLIGPASWGNDGSRADVITSILQADGTFRAAMQGQSVYRWATGDMPAVAKAACAGYGIDISEISWFVPHQANLRILQTIARRLEIPESRLIADVVTAGNTSAASIPLALSALADTERIRPGDLALLLGFGSGLSYAGMVVQLPARNKPIQR